jgi:hypothetical protein
MLKWQVGMEYCWRQKWSKKSIQHVYNEQMANDITSDEALKLHYIIGMKTEVQLIT